MKIDDLDVVYGLPRLPSLMREWEAGVSPVSKSKLDRDLGQKLRIYRDLSGDGLFRAAAQCFLFLWVMDVDGNIIIAYEEIVTGEISHSTNGSLLKNGHPRRRGFPSHPADEKKLGHPTLVGGGEARIAGELFLDILDGSLQWYVSCGSGRYCRDLPPTKRHQEAVHQLFTALIDDQVRFDRL